MKYFEMSVTFGLMIIPVIIAIVGILIIYGWNLTMIPAFLLLGAFGIVFYFAFTDELDEYRKNSTKRV